MRTFAQSLAALLDKSGWTQKQAAEKFGVSQANVSRWLNGGHEPSFEMLIQIASALGVSLDELAGTPATGTKSFPCSEELSDPWVGWAKRLQAAYRRDPDVVASAIRAAWGKETAEQIIEWLNKEKPPLG